MKNKQYKRPYLPDSPSWMVKVGGALVFVLLVGGIGAYLLKGSRASGSQIGIAISPNHSSVWRVDTGGCINGGSCVPHNGSIQGIASYGSNNTGYWLVGSDGGIFSFGGAPYKGSLPGSHITVSNIKGIASPPDGRGYWLVGSDGGVFTFGSLGYYGNGKGKGTDFKAIASTYTGKGYWLLESNGVVRPFGDATGGTVNKGSGAVAIVGSPTSFGYWVLHSNGSISTVGAVGTPNGLSGTYAAAASYGKNGSSCLAALDSGGGVHYTCPSVGLSISAGSTSISYGSSTSITWSSSYAYACSGVSTALKGSVSSGLLTASKTFSESCNNKTHSTPKSVTVKVGAKASLTADSTNLAYNGQTTLHWSSANESSCSIDNGGPSGLKGSGGSWTTPKLTSPVRYTLTCIGINGALNATANVGIAVGGKPAPPSNPGSGGGSTSHGGSNTNQQSVTATLDKTPPSAPGNFTAEVDATTKTVALNWQAAKDNIGVAGYKLERSISDQLNWTTLSSKITQTVYIDQSVNFGTKYTYRLQALDAAGNSSGYVTADVQTSDFSANAFTDSESSFTSEDGVITVVIPPGALSEQAFCSVNSTPDVLPDVNGYVLVSGPYQLNCRNQNGDTITSFNESLTFTAKVDPASLQGIKQVDYYGQAEDGTWDKLNVTSSDSNTGTDTVDLGSHTVFSVMGKKNGTSVLGIIIKLVIFIVIIVFLIRLIIRFLLKRKANKDYDEYLRKSQGL